MFFRKSDQVNGAATPNEAASANGAPAPVAAAPAPPAPPAQQASTEAPKTTAELSPDEVKRRAQLAKQTAASFGELVMLLMRSPSERHLALCDLEWLIVPGVVQGQFALVEAQSRENGVVTPVGGVLWAFVSAEVDARLSDLSTPLRLKPAEWRSGDIPWIVFAIGDNRALAGLLNQLNKTVFKSKLPKMRVRGDDGKFTVGHLEIKEKPAAAPA